MGDRDLRVLERRWRESGAWGDLVRLEAGRDRAGIGPGLVGEAVEVAVELVSPMGTPAGRGVDVHLAEVVWSGVLRPGVWRLDLVVGDDRVRSWWEETAGPAVRALSAAARGVGLLMSTAVFLESLRTALREAEERAGAGGGSGGVPGGVPGGLWRTWALAAGLERVPPPGVAVGRGAVWKGPGCQPPGTVNVAVGNPGRWLVRVDREPAWLVVKVLGGLQQLGPASSEGTMAMGSVPAGFGVPGILRLERLSQEGGPPTREMVSALEGMVETIRGFGQVVGDAAAGIREVSRRISQALHVPGRLLGRGPGRGRGALRELMSDPDVAEGFECEPGVGE